LAFCFEFEISEARQLTVQLFLHPYTRARQQQLSAR
jgi:hypothetical protein